MIIVVEGADCAGKSTWVARLTQGLAAHYAVTTLHAGVPDPDVDVLDQYLTPLTAALEPGSALVLDRWHLGERVYGPLRRGKSLLSPGQHEYVELVMRSVGFAGILCDLPDADLLACYDRRGDDHPAVRREQLTREAELFRLIVQLRPDWHVARVGPTDSVDDWTRRELEVVKRVGSLAPFVRAPVRGAYVGPRWPRVLLVGDRRNPLDQHTPLPWPFVPWRSTSGHWMFEALVREGVPVGQLGFVNGCERTVDELGALWVALGAPKIVALGQNATRQLCGAELPHSVTHHPQWWRRFQHRKTAAFARETWYDVTGEEAPA